MKLIDLEDLFVDLAKYDLRALHIHHTWKPDHSNFNGHNHMQLQENMRNYHVNNRKWDDVAQHLTLMPDGKFVTGRPFGVMPCSIYGKNNKYVLMVEMLGNFDKGHDRLEGPQKEGIMQLTRYCLDRNMEILFHNEYSSKTCPGTSIDKKQFLLDAKNYSKELVNKPSKWAEKAVKWAKDNSISDCSRLRKNCTREEIITMLYRFNELK